jgi:hypothetical protein
MQDAFIYSYVFAVWNLKFSDWKSRLPDTRMTSVREPEKGYYMTARYEQSALDRDSEKRIA